MSPKRRVKRAKRSALWKKAQRGCRGYPIATIAYYGPDDKFASKVAVGIMLGEENKERHCSILVLSHPVDERTR